jgi:hypothetical protein
METGESTPISFVQIAIIKEKQHLVVVRQDSQIELYHFDEVQATQVFKTKEEDTITGLVVGHVASTK